jgi:hypothetical protein
LYTKQYYYVSIESAAAAAATVSCFADDGRLFRDDCWRDGGSGDVVGDGFDGGRRRRSANERVRGVAAVQLARDA